MKNAPEAVGKVLIVGSDRELGKSISEGLHRDGGYHSILAGDGPEVLDILAKEHIDVILTDQQLATGTGFELAFEIRKDRITKPEIILLSSDPNISVFEAHQVGMAHIVQKPVDMGELMQVMKKVIGETRRFERIFIDTRSHGDIVGDVTVSATQKRSHDLSVTNIGRGGFFYKVKDETDLPEVGQIIDFKLKLQMLPDQQFAGRGIVRWAKQTLAETGAGVEFLVIPEESEKLITAFVDLFKIRQFVPSES